MSVQPMKASRIGTIWANLTYEERQYLNNGPMQERIAGVWVDYTQDPFRNPLSIYRRKPGCGDYRR